MLPLGYRSCPHHHSSGGTLPSTACVLASYLSPHRRLVRFPSILATRPQSARLNNRRLILRLLRLRVSANHLSSLLFALIIVAIAAPYAGPRTLY